MDAIPPEIQEVLSHVMPSGDPNAVQPDEVVKPEDEMIADIAKEEEEQLNNYPIAKSYLNQMVSAWGSEDVLTEANRLKRDIDVDISSMRQEGKFEEDETFIPVRVIDTNITRETPPFINFLRNSRRIAIFNDRNDATFDCQLLESAFTKGMTYKGWIKPFYKCIDGAATHGWASVEVVFDPSKPLHVGVEYIAHEDLIFYLEAKDHNASQDVLRRYRVTLLQLRQWARDFGFDLAQVNSIASKYNNTTEKDRLITIYKSFHKKDGIVYVRWFSLEGMATDWLKKPEPLSCGISKQVKVMKPQTVMQPQQVMVPHPQDPSVNVQVTQNVPTQIMVPTMEWQPVPVRTYPIFILPYKETEKPLLFDHIGRVFLDCDKQEAQTAIATAYVNALNRAQNVYASPKTDDVQDGRPAKNANVKLGRGTILDKPMEFWNMPYPDSSVLKALQYFETANSNEVGQVNFAANNRQDSRKTATEINAAQSESQLLNTVDLTLFSEFIRDVYSFAWLIVQSQALQNLIKFLQITPPAQQQMEMLLGSIVNAGGNLQQEHALVNDVDTISREFDIRAAGDVDVIAKEEMIQKMQRDWPVVQNTPLANRFLADYMKLCYPEDGELYSKLLTQGDPKNAIIQALGAALQGIVSMPEVQHMITPQVKAQLMQLEQEAVMAINPQQAPQQQSGAPKSNSAQQKQLPPAQVEKPNGINSPQNQ